MRRAFRKFYRLLYSRANIIIFLALLVMSVGLFVALGYQEKHFRWSDMTLNLSAGAFSSLLTVFFIEVLKDRKDKLSLREGMESALEDMKRLRNTLIIWVSSPLGFDITQYKIDTDRQEESTKAAQEAILSNLIAIDLGQAMTKLPPDKWDSLIKNIEELRKSANENLQYYSSVMPKTVYAKMLKVRRALTELEKNVNLFPFLLNSPEKDWSQDNVENWRSLRGYVVERAARDMLFYLQSVQELHKEVIIWDQKES
ncbi:MAG TPA: hypothetical protein VNA68_00645 [Candidatus Dormibacteraeota bacterium]|nr:hypothetical protein [Candidatus Dormibacteraeota bacterium]